MASHEVICEVLAYLIKKHGYGSPTGKEKAVNLSGVRSDQLGEAKEAFEELRAAPFVNDCGKRGIELDNSKFGMLAEYLYWECGWDEDNIRLRLKHYEGWSQHDWEPDT
jgi:hypothetical protein